MGKCIYASVNRVSIGSDNGLSPVRRQAIIWTSGDILLIGTLETNFSEILIFSYQKMYLKMSSATWHLFSLSLNVLTPSGAKAGLFQENQVSAMTTDALSPCGAMPLAAMALPISAGRSLSSIKTNLKLRVRFQNEMLQNAILFKNSTQIDSTVYIT